MAATALLKSNPTPTIPEIQAGLEGVLCRWRDQERPRGHFRVAARVAGQSQVMHGHEDGVHADEGEPEVDLADAFIQEAPEHFGEPEIESGKHAEDRGNAHDQVEMGHHEVCVMQIQVQRRLRQEQAGEAAAHEQGHKSESEQHRAGELDFAAPDGSQPVEGFDGRGNADGHRQQRESERRVRAHAADEHVVAPHAEAEEADGANRSDHGAVAEHRLAREGREQVRRHAHAGQDGNVHLRMAEEPEQVLPQQRRAALVPGDHLVGDHQAAGNEKAGAGDAVQQQQDAGREEHAERQQAEDRGDEPRPAGERQAAEGHALGAKIDQRGDEIERAHERRAAENRQAYNPQSLARALSGSDDLSERAKSGVRSPAADRGATGHNKSAEHDHEGDERGPERKHVQHGESHVRRADLNRQEVVAEAGLRRRGQHHEDHDGAVHGHERQVLLRRHLAAGDKRQLGRRPGQV